MALESNGPRIVTSLASMTAVALIFMVLRFFCKGRYHKRFGLDDHMLAASWVCLVTYATLTIVSVNYGIGLHINRISGPDLILGLKLLYTGRFLAIIALAFSKTSFAVTLLHLAMRAWERYLIWAIIITLNLIMWVTALSLFVQCNPIYKAWDLSAPGTCWPGNIQVNISITAGAYSAAMDFSLALLPWFLIWKLQMRPTEKFGVIFAMSLGVFAGITAIIKTYFITGSQRSKDFTFTTANLLIWSGAESAATIIAASLPFLRLLIKEVSGKSGRSQRVGGAGRGGAGGDRGAYYLEDMSTSKGKRGLGDDTATIIAEEAMRGGRGGGLKDDDDGESEKSILGGSLGPGGLEAQEQQTPRKAHVKIERGRARIEFS